VEGFGVKEDPVHIEDDRLDGSPFHKKEIIGYNPCSHKRGGAVERMIAVAQLFGLRSQITTPEAMTETFRKLYGMGYRWIQVSAVGKTPLATIRKALDESGLRCCSEHILFQTITGEVQATIDRAKTLGCEAVYVPVLPDEYCSKDGLLKAAEILTRVIPEYQKAGIIVGYHNHDLDFQQYDGVPGMQILLDACPHLDAEFDVHWVQRGGADPAAWIERYSTRCSQVHFKDFTVLPGRKVGQPPVGDGNLNWERIVAACRKANTKYCLVEFDFPPEDPFPAFRRSLENMLSWGLVAE